MFMNLAHRGASEYAPENTLAAFYKGLEMGANGIETDLRLTKDGIIVLFHDDRLDRTTNGTGRVCDFEWKELEGLDAGSWFSSRYSGERILRFDEFLRHFNGKDLIFALELKSEGLEKEVLDLIHKCGINDRTTITAFEFGSLDAVYRLDGSMATGYLTDRIDRDTIDRLKSINARQICPHAGSLNTEDVLLAKAEGLLVRAWGVGTVELMRHALDCGVDGMTVNFPDRLQIT